MDAGWCSKYWSCVGIRSTRILDTNSQGVDVTVKRRSPVSNSTLFARVRSLGLYDCLNFGKGGYTWCRTRYMQYLPTPREGKNKSVSGIHQLSRKEFSEDRS